MNVSHFISYGSILGGHNHYGLKGGLAEDGVGSGGQGSFVFFQPGPYEKYDQIIHKNINGVRAECGLGVRGSCLPTFTSEARSPPI